MSLSSISIKSVRNLHDLSVSFSKSLNFIWGENASGKTSLLESIYLLSTGRSFRTRHIDNIINSDAKSRELIVFGKVNTSKQNEEATPIGVRKSTLHGSEIKISGQSIKSAAILAKLTPVLMVEPQSFDLLTGPPKVRRQFIDWGVFHVEHEFSFLWNDYINCLKQRNSLLRTAKIDLLQLKVWDKRISLLGEQITQHRIEFMDRFRVTFETVLAGLGLNEQSEIGLKYFQGWDKSKSLAEMLDQNRSKDIEKKYTQYGPHRADLKLRISGKNVSEFLSRGQQKLLIIALYIAHVKCLKELNDSQTLVLIDDIAAELDSKNIDIILSNLLELDAQVMCTVLDREIPRDYLDKHRSDCKMFHVEHGRIHEYDYQEKQI
jgi:DNA replication and repair protein RecF